MRRPRGPGPAPSTVALLTKRGDRSPLAVAALAAYLGDLGPALSLLRRAGKESARLEGDLLCWQQEQGLPAGCVCAGDDPPIALAALGFGLFGPLWPEVAQMKAAWEEMLRLWGKARRSVPDRRPPQGGPDHTALQGRLL